MKSFKCPILYLSRLFPDEQMSSTQNLKPDASEEKWRPGGAVCPQGADLVPLFFISYATITNSYNERLGYSSLEIQIQH